MDELANRLGRVSHFRHLTAQALLTIVTSGRLRRFAAGTTIFYEGQPCAGMFVLLSGRVNMCKPGPQGQEQIVAVIDPVIMFNEVAVLDGGPNPTTAFAVRPCVTWQIGYQEFQRLMQQYPDPAVALGLLRVLAARNRALIARCEDLSYRSVQARLAKLLLGLSHNGSRPIARQDYPIRELSGHVGTVPELVSRSLRILEDGGLISFTRAQIVVTDVQGLARLAQIEICAAAGGSGEPDRPA